MTQSPRLRSPLLVSSKGARGIAQFMPATASWRGLKNPFDPIEAIAEAGQLLNELRREFDNIGLAAAAYNAGSRRVRQWLARRQGLPRETQQYVRVITGQRAEEWTVSATATYRGLVARKFDGSRAQRRVGRPPIDKEVEDLIVRMAKENRPWGYDRIVGALANLDIVSPIKRSAMFYAA